jgi:hypothetical protein
MLVVYASLDSHEMRGRCQGPHKAPGPIESPILVTRTADLIGFFSRSRRQAEK